VIPFNKPYLTGNELKYIGDAVQRGKISGNGFYTQKCQEYFQEKYGFKKCLLTTSGTSALEMAAILCNIQAGDEVIIPSYTFPSTANAFILRGAKIVFADSKADHPGVDESKIEALVTPRTKVIVPVHYAGNACNMDVIMDIANRHALIVVEDAAQAVDSLYKSKPLAGIGHLGCFSFHETKNIQSGEGGMLVINDERYIRRAEIIWEKGTNRVEFFRGEVNKYGWVDIGSSFLPSEITAAFLWAQMENLDNIQRRRKEIWNRYNEFLSQINDGKRFSCPILPDYSSNNAHMFYLVCKTTGYRMKLISLLKRNNIQAVFHYMSLHASEFFAGKHNDRPLPNSDRYANCLVRLPFFYELEENQISRICEMIKKSTQTEETEC